jgi:MoaA/NifB/PqqE/SkfB family radical SAM enzyme
MANLAISAVCNQNCAYCFAREHLGHPVETQAHGDLSLKAVFLPVALFQQRLDFLSRSEIEVARLLGGEPTLHPDFVELVERVQAAGMRLQVFSNGLMPERALACLEGLPPEQCTVTVNVSQRTTADDQAHVRQRETIRRLGKRAIIGFNIYRSDFKLDFLASLVLDHDCNPMIRLAMAQPCLSGRNEHIYPNQYRAIAIRIVDFVRSTAELNITVGLDCGFVRCMFSNAELDLLGSTGADIGWRCNPILDVDLAGNVFPCYPLSSLVQVPLTPDLNAATLRRMFQERTRPYRRAGVYRECSTCDFKSNGSGQQRASEGKSLEVCSGGCLATTIRRFRHTPFSLLMPGAEDTSSAEVAATRPNGSAGTG